MRGNKAPRVSVDALEAWWAKRNEQPFNNRMFSRQCGAFPSAIYVWRREGGIPIWTADVIAIRLGVHPAHIWPEWFALARQEDMA